MTCLGHLIDGQWVNGTGPAFESLDPATGARVWSGRSAAPDDINSAALAARRAFEAWSATSLEHRTKVMRAFAERLDSNRGTLAEMISRETGKPLWDAQGEVDAMVGKIEISIEAYLERRSAPKRSLAGAAGVTRFKPHGVVAVFGPFNFPGHVPNGHLVPALLAGNTAVFKPSEKAPLVAQKTVELWQSANLPDGVLNLLQGGRDTGENLAQHEDINGVYFTGGYAAGIALQRALASRPGTIVALELGGNNPLVVHDAADLDAAVYLAIQSAFITAGQRCTCARRLIVPHGGAGDAFIDRLADATQRVRVGPYTLDPQPFSGPLISDEAADAVLAAQRDLADRGGKILVECKQVGDRRAMLGPGLIDVTSIGDRADREIFGPLLMVIRVADYDAALDEANKTRFGLVAALLSDSRAHYERFVQHVRAGLINWNRPTTGASSLLPFGGADDSGNHRPTGYYAADYCAYPVASIECDRLALPERRTPGIEP